MKKRSLRPDTWGALHDAPALAAAPPLSTGARLFSGLARGYRNLRVAKRDLGIRSAVYTLGLRLGFSGLARYVDGSAKLHRHPRSR